MSDGYMVVDDYFSEIRKQYGDEIWQKEHLLLASPYDGTEGAR